jgi:hypothetical protein
MSVKNSSSNTRELVPSDPVATNYRPQVYQAFSQAISSPDVVGVGANVCDLEILRLACIEKLKRDGSAANRKSGFTLNFLANLHSPWSEELVIFWSEGLGIGWNLLVNDDSAIRLLERIAFRPSRNIQIFTLFPLPARPPGFDCELHEDFAVCRYNGNAEPLTSIEKTAWEQLVGERGYYRRGYEHQATIDWSDFNARR